MSNSTRHGPFPVRLSRHERVVVATQPAQHVHALRQFRRYLPGREIDVVEWGELATALPTLEAEGFDLLVLLTVSRDCIKSSKKATKVPSPGKGGEFVAFFV